MQGKSIIIGDWMGSCMSLTAAYSNNQQQYSIIINNKKAPTDLSIFYSSSDIACSESVKIHHPNKNPKSPSLLVPDLILPIPANASSTSIFPGLILIPIPIPTNYSFFPSNIRHHSNIHIPHPSKTPTLVRIPSTHTRPPPYPKNRFPFFQANLPDIDV